MATWSGRSRGGMWIQWLVAALAQAVGSRGIHIVSWYGGIIAMLSNGQARNAAIGYQQRRCPGIDRTEAVGLAWRQCASFGRILCDRGFVYGRRPPRLEQRGAEYLVAAARQPQGCIMLSAHVGNWEFAGRLWSRLAPDRELQVVRVMNNDPREQAMVERAMGDRAPSIIDPRDPLAASLAIQAALDRGAMIGFLGDRVHGQQPSLSVPLLGSPIRVPMGPFQAAQSSGCPILVCFLLRRGDRRYLLETAAPIYVHRPAVRRQRRAALETAARQYVSLLESVVRRYPFQWHNFFDAWKIDD